MIGAPALAAVRAGRHITTGLFTTLAALGTARLAPLDEPRRRANRLSRSLRELCAVHDFRTEITGLIPTMPALLVANHVGYLDPVVILAASPAVPIAKGEVEGWPMIGPASASLGVMFVDRDSPTSRVRTLRRALAAFANGASVLNFPEGTTTDGSRLLPFHRGSFGAAILAGVPVVPIALRYADPAMCWTGNATFLPHYLRTAAKSEVVTHLHYGAPIEPRRGERAEELAARVRVAIARALQLPTALPAPRRDRPVPRRIVGAGGIGRIQERA
jgi:1-acyl-sn-glycerol-3-phosphate acyltransferase